MRYYPALPMVALLPGWTATGSGLVAV